MFDVLSKPTDFFRSNFSRIFPFWPTLLSNEPKIQFNCDQSKFFSTSQLISSEFSVDFSPAKWKKYFQLKMVLIKLSKCGVLVTWSKTKFKVCRNNISLFPILWSFEAIGIAVWAVLLRTNVISCSSMSLFFWIANRDWKSFTRNFNGVYITRERSEKSMNRFEFFAAFYSSIFAEVFDCLFFWKFNRD